MTVSSSLSHRGVKYATLGREMRDKFKALLPPNPYDPEKNPDGFVNIGVAENFLMLPEVQKYANSKMQFGRNDFTYGEGPWGLAKLRKALAGYMEKYFHSVNKIDPEKIIVATGVTAICEMLGYVIGDPGDGVLFPRPIYQAFRPDFETKAQIKSVFVDFDDVDPFSPEAAAKFEEALVKAERQGTKIRALMLCNPHNPLGRCYPLETIKALMRLCSKYSLHLLSDEVYALSVYDVPDKKAVPFTSVLSFDSSSLISKDLVHVLYSMSKDMAGGGLRLGTIYTESEEMLAAMGAIPQFHWTSQPAQSIAAEMLADDEWLPGFLETSKERLSHSNKLTRSLLEDAGISYYHGANAGFFLWVDFRPWVACLDGGASGWEGEATLAAKFIEAGVFLTPGQGLSSEEPGWFRFIFSQEDTTLKEGMRRILKVLHSIKS